MAMFAIVENVSITNVIIADDEATALSVSRPGAIAIEVQPSDHVGQAWTYDGEKLVAPKFPEEVIQNG